MNRIPALDGLRGLAIALVLLAHTELVRGAWVGVDLFFVLSGFLITSLLLERGTLRGFYERRARRLLPALVAVLAVWVAVTHDVRNAAFSLLYVANFSKASHGMYDMGLGHMWSLSVEEQFYVLFPLLLFAALAFRVPAKAMVAGLLVVVVGLWAYRYELAMGDASIEQVRFSPFVTAAPILLGCALGVAYTRGYLTRIRGGVAALLVALGIAFAMSPSLDMQVAVLMPIFAVAAGVLVLVCTLDAASPVSRMLSTRPLVYLGTISYGLYLWHLPIIYAVGWELGIPLAIVLAAASWRYLERPILQSRRSLPRPRRLVAATSES